MVGRFHDNDDWNEWGWLNAGRWEHNVRATFRGKRGQAMLAELEEALLAMSEHRLILGDIVRPAIRCINDEGDLETVIEACAIGAFALYRGLPAEDLSQVSPDSYSTAELGRNCGMSYTMAWRIGEENDEWPSLTPEQRWQHMIDWVRQQRATPNP